MSGNQNNKKFQLELHTDPKIDRRNGMRKQIATVPLISTGQAIAYAYRNRSKGLNLAMANWLNETTKWIFVCITSKIESETNLVQLLLLNDFPVRKHNPLNCILINPAETPINCNSGSNDQRDNML